MMPPRNAGREASAALAAYRSLRLYPDQEQAGKLVPALSAYVKALVLDEYPAMAEGTRSQGAAAAAVGFPPNIYPGGVLPGAGSGGSKGETGAAEGL